MVTTFSINGKPYQVDLSRLPADITLNTFIREHAGLTATKFMCQEGGCGVCVVAVTGKHPSTGEIKTWAVNSCLTLLNSCADWEITTSEGIGNKQIGYHPIQKRLAKMNGTQCGFCSPGFVMNMYALLEAKPQLTMAEIENSFGGNICRCTGYRPILDAMKSFAVDSNIEVPSECLDIEDLSTKKCPKTGDLCSGSCRSPKSSITYSDGSRWHWPKTIAEIFQAFNELKSNEKYMLVAGNTAHGVYRRSPDVKVFIDINQVGELTKHSLENDKLVLGGNLSLTETMDILLKAKQKSGFEYCDKVWKHFDLIANVPVRNTGSLAGNFAIKHQYKEFPSDVFILFEALDAQVLLQNGPSEEKLVTIAEYLKTPMEKKLIKAFVLKAYPETDYLFGSYKIMPRAQNAHAYVNAAFLVNIEKATHKVLSSRLCFGGINPEFVHATDVEEALLGKNLFDEANLQKAFSLLTSKLKANEVLPDPSPEFREKLAFGLFYKFLLANAPNLLVADRLKSGGEVLKREVSSGKQSFDTNEASYPVTKPTEKHEGLIQCSGEATYTNDVQTLPNQLWAAFVTGKKVGAKVTGFDTTEALAKPGVVAFFNSQDIPGKNNIVGVEPFFFPLDEQLLVPVNEGTIKYYNQPIGIILAETNALAQQAANLVKVHYEGGSATILPTLHDVLNSASTDRMQQKVKSMITELKLTEDYDLKGKGQLDLGLQFHFHMEPHSTVAIPFEGGLQMYTATQWTDLVQVVVAEMLNLRNTDVQVKTRRIGGGFGGKATRCNMAACAAALAAYKLNRPVRFVQSIESMMDTLGKRWPCHAEYEFFVKKDGKIVGLQNKFYQDAGYLENESPMGHSELLSKNCYEFSGNYKLDGYMVYTDAPTNTPCRAPGSVEGIAMMENIIEQIAFETQQDPVEVRKRNLISGHKMAEMLPNFIAKTEYYKRKEAIDNFNKENRWLKKGLGLSIMEYQIGYFGQYPATLAIYHGDGSVVISHGGIEMGQGMNTKIAQVVAFALGIPLNLIRIESSTTINGANAMVTGGAVGSESLCFAIRKCCNTINERLKPVKESLKGASWQEIINEAFNQKINLIVSDHCKQGEMTPYTVCGLCLSEVEVDVLTGSYLVKRVNILEDTGESLNPNVDIGQIEGAFMMGLSYWTTEKCLVDKTTGELKTNRTWNYKPMGAKDIPIDLRIDLLPKAAHEAGFMRSKATGEPAICLAVGIGFALQYAIQAARNDAGLPRKWVPLSAPMTPEEILLNAGTTIDMMKLK